MQNAISSGIEAESHATNDRHRGGAPATTAAHPAGDTSPAPRIWHEARRTRRRASEDALARGEDAGRVVPVLRGGEARPFPAEVLPPVVMRRGDGADRVLRAAERLGALVERAVRLDHGRRVGSAR